MRFIRPTPAGDYNNDSSYDPLNPTLNMEKWAYECRRLYALMCASNFAFADDGLFAEEVMGGFAPIFESINNNLSGLYTLLQTAFTWYDDASGEDIPYMRVLETIAGMTAQSFTITLPDGMKFTAKPVVGRFDTE